MSNRDRQFSNFANALYMELQNIYQERSLVLDGIDADQCVIRHIARRAYDLVKHTIDQITPTIRELWTDSELLELIPDLTELPKEQE